MDTHPELTTHPWNSGNNDPQPFYDSDDESFTGSLETDSESSTVEMEDPTNIIRSKTLSYDDPFTGNQHTTTIQVVKDFSAHTPTTIAVLDVASMQIEEASNWQKIASEALPPSPLLSSPHLSSPLLPSPPMISLEGLIQANNKEAILNLLSSPKFLSDECYRRDSDRVSLIHLCLLYSRPELLRTIGYFLSSKVAQFSQQRAQLKQEIETLDSSITSQSLLLHECQDLLSSLPPQTTSHLLSSPLPYPSSLPTPRENPSSLSLSPSSPPSPGEERDTSLSPSSLERRISLHLKEIESLERKIRDTKESLQHTNSQLQICLQLFSPLGSVPCSHLLLNQATELENLRSVEETANELFTVIGEVRRSLRGEFSFRPDSADETGHTLLHKAAIYGLSPLVHACLLWRRPWLLSFDKRGSLPVHLSLDAGFHTLTVGLLSLSLEDAYSRGFSLPQMPLLLRDGKERFPFERAVCRGFFGLALRLFVLELHWMDELPLFTTLWYHLKTVAERYGQGEIVGKGEMTEERGKRLAERVGERESEGEERESVLVEGMAYVYFAIKESRERAVSYTSPLSPPLPQIQNPLTSVENACWSPSYNTTQGEGQGGIETPLPFNVQEALSQRVMYEREENESTLAALLECDSYLIGSLPTMMSASKMWEHYRSLPPLPLISPLLSRLADMEERRKPVLCLTHESFFDHLAMPTIPESLDCPAQSVRRSHRLGSPENASRLEVLTHPGGILRAPFFSRLSPISPPSLSSPPSPPKTDATDHNKTIQWLREVRRATISDVMTVHTPEYLMKLQVLVRKLQNAEKKLQERLSEERKSPHHMELDSDSEIDPSSPHYLTTPLLSSPSPLPHINDLTIAIDSDTLLSSRSYHAALHAVGTCFDAIDLVCRGYHKRAFALVRPPGHHMGPNGSTSKTFELADGNITDSQGFCLFNNVALAAAYCLKNYSPPPPPLPSPSPLSVFPHEIPNPLTLPSPSSRPHIRKIAIVDFDVHHGNGTEACVRNIGKKEIYESIKSHLAQHPSPHDQRTLKQIQYHLWNSDEDRENLFFASLHVYDGSFYPCTGQNTSPLQHTGPVIINATTGASDTMLEIRERVRREILLPLSRFRPDIILISAGFDAHVADILNQGLGKFHDGDFFWVTKELIGVANAYCEGRVVSVLEGGYNTAARRASPFARSVAAHVSALSSVTGGYRVDEETLVREMGEMGERGEKGERERRCFGRWEMPFCGERRKEEMEVLVREKLRKGEIPWRSFYLTVQSGFGRPLLTEETANKGSSSPPNKRMKRSSAIKAAKKIEDELSQQNQHIINPPQI